MQAHGRAGEKMKELLAIEDSDTGEEIVGVFNENELEFTVEGVLVLKMKVELREVVHEKGAGGKELLQNI